MFRQHKSDPSEIFSEAQIDLVRQLVQSSPNQSQGTYVANTLTALNRFASYIQRGKSKQAMRALEAAQKQALLGLMASPKLRLAADGRLYFDISAGTPYDTVREDWYDGVEELITALVRTSPIDTYLQEHRARFLKRADEFRRHGNDVGLGELEDIRDAADYGSLFTINGRDPVTALTDTDMAIELSLDSDDERGQPFGPGGRYLPSVSERGWPPDGDTDTSRRLHSIIGFTLPTLELGNDRGAL